MGLSFKLKTFENVGYNAFGRVIYVVFQGVTNIILARNLVSSDYGIAGFAMIVTGFLSQFGDFGIQTAILQTGKLDEKGLYTGFTIKAALGFGIFAAALLLAPAAGFFFKNAEVTGVIRLLSLIFVINSFAFIPNVLLTRDLDYRRMFFPQTASVVINSLLSILLARGGFGYWSIILANVVSTAVLAAGVNLARPVKVRFMYDRERASEFLRFGGNIFLTGLLAFAIFNADNFIIGVFKGARALGYYTVAFNWGSMVCGMLGAVVLTVLFPTFSKFQDDRPRLKAAYLRVLTYVSFAGILVEAGLFSVSGDFLFLVLGRGGDKWLLSLVPLQILCGYGILRLFMEPAGSVILAMGKSGPLLRAQVVVAAVELSLIYPAQKYFGIEGVACAVTLAYFFEYVMLFPLLRGELGLTLSEWTAPALPAALSALVAGGVSMAVRGLFPLSLAGLSGKIFLFTFIYCLAYGILTGWKMVAEVKDIYAELCPGGR